jgi:hypothetical protein
MYNYIDYKMYMCSVLKREECLCLVYCLHHETLRVREGVPVCLYAVPGSLCTV